ncbi:MAG: 3-deoxy-manno-octulosonate cytidylyltransferase [Candidatus Aminicenantia bacterium]
MSKAIAIIPARFHSSRLPGKPLILIKGKPLIQHVWEKAIKASKIDKVLVATDSEEIFEKVKEFGGECVMTSSSHRSGTERIAEVVKDMDYKTVVNVQSDEPMIEPYLIDRIVEELEKGEAPMISIYEIWDTPEDFINPNTVKVVIDNEGYALYFSRSPIPFSKNERIFFRHVGIYGYRRDTLLELVNLPPSFLETKENLEQLRALENGIKIKMLRSNKKTFGVDTIEDLRKIEMVLQND